LHNDYIMKDDTHKPNVFSELFMQYLTYVGIKLLLLINNIKTHSEISYYKLYENNESFHKCIDTLHVNAYYIRQLAVPYYLEPPFSCFTVCYKDQTYKEEYINMDSILYDTKISPTLSGLHLTYTAIFSVIKPLIKTNELEYLLTLHYRNLKYDCIITRLMGTGDIYRVACDAVPTKNYFLSVEYQHPSMKNTISLNMDKRYLIAGNELFSPCFVLKCLNYQKEQYFFDNDYKLTILDSEIKSTTLSSNQYIRLTKSKYEVIELKSNNKTD
jgi:hypothetical protein